MSTEADALAAIAALLAGVRTTKGWTTDLGADVRKSFQFSELADDADWQTLVYTATETYTTPGLPDAEGIAGNQRTYDLTLVIHIDAHRRLDGIETADAAADIKADVRRAVLVPSGRLKLAGVEVGAIRYLGNELIPEALASGALGVRTRVRVNAKQTITH